MKVEFAGRHAELNVVASFEEPMFSLAQDPLRLVSLLHRHLRDQAPAVETLTMQTQGNPATWAISWFLHGYSTSIRVEIQRVEIQCSRVEAVGSARVGGLVTGVAAALEDYLGQPVHLSFLMSTFAAHGELQKQDTTSYLARFLGEQPDGLGEPFGRAVAFYYPKSQEFEELSITLDVSRRIDSGLFVRIQTFWNADAISLKSLPQSLVLVATRAFDAVRLSPSWDSAASSETLQSAEAENGGVQG